MKFFKRLQKNKSQTSSNKFRKFIDNQMNYLEFSPTTQKGLLFFLGASLVAEVNDTSLDLGFDRNDKIKFTNFLKEITNYYSRSTEDLADYEDLDPSFFTYTIYNYSYVIHSVIINSDADFDENLRKIKLGNGEIIPIKTKLDENLIEKYKSNKFSLNTFQNLSTDFFDKIGSYLESINCSNEQSYEAGFAYFNMSVTLDVKGTFFLFNVIRKLLPASYMIFWQFPILHKLYQKELHANHVFSSILQFHYGALAQKGPVQLVHKFHQMLFYEPNTADLRSLWDFKNVDQGKMIMMLFYQTIDMRRIFLNNKKDFIHSEETTNKNLIGVSVTKVDFLNEIIEIVYEKYNINLTAEGWNNFGDYLQGLAIFYYECAMHILLPKEIVD